MNQFEKFPDGLIATLQDYYRKDFMIFKYRNGPAVCKYMKNSFQHKTPS